LKIAKELLKPTKSTRIFYETISIVASQTKFTYKSGLALSYSLRVEKTLVIAIYKDTTKNSQGISNKLPLTLY
jgi:hypothetical protein